MRSHNRDPIIRSHDFNRIIVISWCHSNIRFVMSRSRNHNRDVASQQHPTISIANPTSRITILHVDSRIQDIISFHGNVLFSSFNSRNCVYSRNYACAYTRVHTNTHENVKSQNMNAWPETQTAQPHHDIPKIIIFAHPWRNPKIAFEWQNHRLVPISPKSLKSEKINKMPKSHENDKFNKFPKSCASQCFYFLGGIPKSRNPGVNWGLICMPILGFPVAYRGSRILACAFSSSRVRIRAWWRNGSGLGLRPQAQTRASIIGPPIATTPAPPALPMCTRDSLSWISRARAQFLYLRVAGLHEPCSF